MLHHDYGSAWHTASAGNIGSAGLFAVAGWYGIARYRVSAWLQARVSSERGASLVEYALLVSLIATVCFGAVSFLGRETADSLSSLDLP